MTRFDGENEFNFFASLDIQLVERITAYPLAQLINRLEQVYFSSRWLELAENNAEGAIFPDDHKLSESEELLIEQLEIGTPNRIKIQGLLEPIVAVAVALHTILNTPIALADLELKHYEIELKKVEIELKKVETKQKEVETKQKDVETKLKDVETKQKEEEIKKLRAEEEKLRAEEEKSRAEEEKLRAEIKKLRAEEEKSRAEEEKLRAEIINLPEEARRTQEEVGRVLADREGVEIKNILIKQPIYQKSQELYQEGKISEKAFKHQIETCTNLVFNSNSVSSIIDKKHPAILNTSVKPKQIIPSFNDPRT